MSIPTKPISPQKQTKKSSCPSLILTWATAFIFCCSLFSCSSSISDETHLIDQGKWSENNPLSFAFDIQDTTLLYDIFLEINHSADYPFQNIFCMVQSFAPGGLLAQQQITPLELATRQGKWMGNCDSETCTRKIPFIINTQFNVPGQYSIVLTQFTRNETLEGINSLRLIVQQAT